MKEKIQVAKGFVKEQLNSFNNVALISSFGKDSIVAHNLVRQIKPDIPVVWVIPPFLPDETHELAKEVIEDWGVNIYEYRSEFVEDEDFMNNVVMGGEEREPLYERAPENCCEIFKVQPGQRAVKELDLDAWFSGLRATESEKRSKYTKVWQQGEGNIIKLHPILNWEEEEVWNYTEKHDLPYHPWYDKDGIRSIGCAPCTNKSADGTERGGRWLGTFQQGGGCGLHCKPNPKSQNSDCSECN